MRGLNIIYSNGMLQYCNFMPHPPSRWDLLMILHILRSSWRKDDHHLPKWDRCLAHCTFWVSFIKWPLSKNSEYYLLDFWLFKGKRISIPIPKYSNYISVQWGSTTLGNEVAFLDSEWREDLEAPLFAGIVAHLSVSGVTGALGCFREMPSVLDCLSTVWEEFKIMGNNWKLLSLGWYFICLFALVISG